VNTQENCQSADGPFPVSVIMSSVNRPMLVGYCHWKGQLCRLGLISSPTYKIVMTTNLINKHMLYVTKVLPELRFCHLQTHLMKSNDYLNAPVSKVMHFIQDAQLLEG
jgi:hypothetical protein